LPTPERISLAIFDWGGTTVDFGCLAPAGAFVAAFAERGVAVTMAEVRGPMGLHKKDHMREMLRTAQVGDKWRAKHGRDWSEADIDDLYRLVTPMQVAAAAKYGIVLPGVNECMSTLRSRGLKIGASTGYFQEAADVTYNLAKEGGYVPDYSICADEVPAGRPAPWMIFRVMEKLGVYPPSAVVKVGDTVVDIIDGLNAGCWSVGIIDTGNEIGLSEAEFTALPTAERDARRTAARTRLLAAGAHAVANTIAEIPAIIASLPIGTKL